LTRNSGGKGWTEGAGVFNSKEPLLLGAYRVELIKVENSKYFATAYTNLSINTFEFIESLDPNVKVSLSISRPPIQESIKTTFASGEVIYPFTLGLKNNIIYSFRVVGSNKSVIVTYDILGGPTMSNG